MGLKHAYKSPKTDPADASLVGASKWNADHYFLDAASAPIGAVGDLAYRGTGGLVTLLTGAAGVLQSAGAGQVPAFTMSPTLTSLIVTGAIEAGSVLITGGGGTISGPELAVLDGVVPGTVTASKAVVVDANKDIASFRNLTASGIITTPILNGLANLLVQKNGAAAQTFRVYNNDSGADSSYFEMQWASNYLFALVKKTGAGVSNGLEFGTAAGAGGLYFHVNGGDRWQITSTGHLQASTDNTYDLGASGATRPRNVFTGSDVVVGGHLTVANGNFIRWASLSKLQTAVDGNLVLLNFAATDFGRLQFGGTSASFPALKRVGAGLSVRLADDSADGAITAATVIVGVNPSTSGAIRLPNNTGIYFRNAANTIDLAALLVDATNQLVLASANVTQVVPGGGNRFFGSAAVPWAGVYSAIYGSANLTGTLVTNDAQTIADNAVINLGAAPTTGLLVVSASNGVAADFLLSNGTVFELHDPNSWFSAAIDTAGTYNVYYSTANSRYELQNKTGASRTVRLMRLGN